MQTADLGVLVGELQMKAALRGRYGFEYLPFYTEAASRAGKTVVFFTPRSFSVGKRLVRAYHWNPSAQTYQEGIYRLPTVIHNRALLIKQKDKQIYSHIVHNGSVLYNRTMRFDKWRVHRQLGRHLPTAGYLPQTETLVSAKQIVKWLDRFPVIYLKPRSGSLGIGVIRLRRTPEGVKVTRTVNGRFRQNTIPHHQIQLLYKRLEKRPYLIQEGISMLRHRRQPVDFRVSVQKSGTGMWTVSGIVAKIGKEGSHATNLAVGGKAVAARRLLERVFGMQKANVVYGRLKQSGLLIARQLERMDPHVADLGLDLTVTRNGAVKFFEANGRDLRITFRNARQRKMWRNTFQNPIRYGIFLLNKQNFSS
ncbi:YheC/YheD family protein [Effusibacillus lacus]|uniref:YheC/YheD family protein n=1 Tax=Effusibacillus lacus TaxID=1348429 RepID=A0A292YS45_9BACL|nr:YheC/YheD family protein [Effusibacillus lacus]GAX91593.1 hypothetical protein EFBL_3283 [Effusibacillus lacus]